MSSLKELSPRELDVAHLLAEGLSNKKIGEALGISDHTAKFHVNNVIKKLAVPNRTRAAVIYDRMQRA